MFKMPKATPRLLIFAALGLAISLLWYGWLKSPGETVTLLEATHDLTSGTSLTREHIRTVEFPKRYAPVQGVPGHDLELVLGRNFATRLPSGSILRWDDFEEAGNGADHLASDVPVGYRALALPSLQEGALQRWLRSGDTIDVLGNFTLGTQQVTRTLFQRVKVMATKPHLILLVTPEQAELLLFAKRQGDLFVSLRNREDQTTSRSLPEVEFRRFLSSVETRSAITTSAPQVISLIDKVKP